MEHLVEPASGAELRTSPAAETSVAPDANGGGPILLQAKLTPPRLGDTQAVLHRPRLVARIRESSEQRLVSVCAPAGYGKTTLVAQAVDDGERLLAWLSLDSRDNDPGRFVAHLVGALQRAAGPTEILAERGGAERHVAEATLEAALNRLAGAAEAITLVLDDVHRITNPLVHHLIEYLIEFKPPQLRVVLVSRTDPPLPLARVRARGELVELRAADLSFTRAETAELLARAGGDPFPPGLVSSVHARTEGWVVALQLLQLLLRGQAGERRAAILEGFVGSRRQVADYLLTEVLAQQVPARRRFLLQTSILARLTGPLCDVVTEGRGGQSMLHALEQDGVLLFGLDEQRRWYRFHHLLAELLVQQLTDEEGFDGVAALHRRASAWLADNDLLDDAIDHALAAGDWASAMELIHRVRAGAAGFRGTMTLRRWLEALPAPLREADPSLDFWYGRALASTAQPRRARPILDRIEQIWAAEGAPHRISEVRNGRAWVAIHEGRVDDALALAQSVIEVNTNGSRAQSLQTFGVALVRAGRARAALAAFAEARAEQQLPLTAEIELGRALALAGRLREAVQHINAGLDYDNLTDSHRRGHVWLAEIYQAWNDLDRAHDHLERAEDLAYFFDAESFYPSLEIARARLLWSAGKTKLAHAELAEGIRRARAAGMEAAARAAEAVRAAFWLAQGRDDDAVAWARRAELHPAVAPDYLYIEDHLIYARLLIDTGAAPAASALLSRLRRAAEEDGRVVDAGRILVLETLARQAQENHDAAHDSLLRAVVTLEPSGHIRAFEDDGQAFTAQLRSIAASGSHLDYVTALLEAGGQRPPPAPLPSGGLVDPLSNRELEVLRLVSVGLSNREISDQLFISVPTVKRHISTILDKLAASSRTQAVSVARSLTLI